MGTLFNTHIATALFAFFSLVVAIVHSTYCCRATCCGNQSESTNQKPRVVYQPYPVPIQPASNPGYQQNEGGTPQLYHITQQMQQPQYVPHPQAAQPAPLYQSEPTAPAHATLNLQQQYEQQYNNILQPPSYNDSLNLS